MGTKTPSCRPSKIDRLRQALVDLLPSQHDTTLICRASGSWLLTYGLTPQMPGVFEEHNDGVVSSNIDIDEVRKQHPTVVARALLYIAVFLQQLDATFDTNRLHILPSIDSRVEKYLSTVQSLITADDELVSTIEGIECLILQGIFYMNAGSPRRAWLSFRRALTVGQLIGIHKRDYSTTSSVGNQLWQQINKADRYLGLLLGLPVGSLDDRFGPDETFQNPDADKDLIFSRKLGELTGHIISRNQTENTHAYANTQEIDDKLEDLAKQMPKSWWEIPTKLSNDHAKSTAVQFERLMTQIWYFQLVAILHLPFMLRASTERRYDYSKFSCLKASRQMLHRYLKLRFPDTKSFCCRIVDFGALTATVTLFLGVLEQAQPGESDETRKQRKNDHALIQSVLEVMENISRHSKDVVAAQCVEVIKSLMAVESQTAENGKLRLTIPYFGTISIVRPAPVRPPVNKPSNLVVEHQESINFGRTPSQDWSGAPYPTPSASISPESSHVPTVSFYSSQFPQFIPEPQPPIGDLGWHESDTLFFDSLLSTDLEGNWLF